MELDDNNEKKEKPNTVQVSVVADSNFKIQDVENEEDLGEIVIKLNSWVDNEQIKVVQGINKSKKLKQLIDKFNNNLNKITPKELSDLQDKLFTAGDYKVEDDEYYRMMEILERENKEVEKDKKRKIPAIKKEAKELATINAIKNALENIKGVLGNRRLVSKVKSFAKSLKSKSKKSQIMVKDSNGEENQVNIDKVVELVEQIEKDKEVGEEGKDEPKQEKDEIVQKKKQWVEFFKQKKQDKFKKAFNVIEQANLALNNAIEKANNLEKASNNLDVSFKGMKDYVKDSWSKLASANVCNVNSALDEYLSNCSRWCNEKTQKNENDGHLVQIGVIFKTLLVRINLLEDAVKSLTVCLNDMMAEKKELAKFGPTSLAKINHQMILKSHGGKNKRQRVDDKEWNDLSEFGKYKRVFRFSDFTQNVPVGWFRKFSPEQKAQFLEERTNWQKERMIKIAELFKENPDKYTKFLDTFLFYWNRDKFGLEINTSGLEKHIKLDENDRIILDGLKDTLEDLSAKGLVFNKLLVNDKYIFTNGLSTARRIEKLNGKMSNYRRGFESGWRNNGKRYGGPRYNNYGGMRNGRKQGQQIYNNFPPEQNKKNINYLSNKRERDKGYGDNNDYDSGADLKESDTRNPNNPNKINIKNSKNF